MIRSNPVLVPGAIVVHHDLPVGSLLQDFLVLPGGRQVSESRLALLQPPPVEAVRAVDIDGPADVAHVVGDERPTIQHQVGARARPARLQLLPQVVHVQSTHLKQQIPLER